MSSTINTSLAATGATASIIASTLAVGLTGASSLGFSASFVVLFFNQEASNDLMNKAIKNVPYAALLSLGSLGGFYGMTRLNHVNRPGAIVGTLAGLAAGGVSLLEGSERLRLIGTFNPKSTLQGAAKVALATSLIVGGLFGLGSDLYQAYKNRNQRS